MKTTPDFDTALRPVTIMQMTIWGAMTASKAMYLVVIHLIVSLNQPIVLPIPDYARWLLVSVGAALAFFSIMLWRKWTSPESLQQLWQSIPVNELDPSAPESDYEPARNLPSHFSRLSESEKRLFLVMRRLQVKMIICLALNDGLAAIGLITGILGQGLARSIPLILTAMLANLFVLPRTRAMINDLPDPMPGNDVRIL